MPIASGRGGEQARVRRKERDSSEWRVARKNRNAAERTAKHARGSWMCGKERTQAKNVAWLHLPVAEVHETSPESKMQTGIP